MNKKLLMLTLVSLVLPLMLTSAVAKSVGPQKAGEKNPNMEIMPPDIGPPPTAGGVEAFLPSGGIRSWSANTSEMPIDIIHGLDASRAKGLMKKAEVITPSGLEEWMMMLILDPETALENLKNKWFYFSYDTLVAMFMMEGYNSEDAAAMASMWPDGMYVRFVNLGPTWDA
jgi:hypothetical protein